MGLTGITIPEFTNHTTPLVLALDKTVPWNMTLRITETSGTGNTVIIGEEPDASDGLDHYDLPEPPAPPQFPFIRSWFATSFVAPYNNLLQEYKSSYSDHAMWNLSIVWVPAPGNQSATTVLILWDPVQVNANHTHSLLLYENDMIVANMITKNSYSFSTNGSLHRFQIIGLSKSTNGTSEQSNMPVLPILLAIIVLAIVIIIALYFYKRKK